MSEISHTRKVIQNACVPVAGLIKDGIIFLKNLAVLISISCIFLDFLKESVLNPHHF